MTIVFAFLFVVLTASGSPEDPGATATFNEPVAVRHAYSSGGIDNFSPMRGEDEYPGFQIEYTITVVDTWPVTSESGALGLDYIDFWYGDDIVAYVSSGAVEDEIYWMNANTGVLVSTAWDCAATNTLPWGVVHVPFTGDDEIHVNDLSQNEVFYREWDTGWSSYNHLCGNDGRGMDYYAADDRIFELFATGTPGNYSHFVAVYTPGSSTGSTYEIDCIAGNWYAAGCTVFPEWGGSIGIAVTMYESSWIRFFEYPGNPGGVYYGYGVLPYAGDMDYSLGLAYSDERDTFFHSWENSVGDYYISELAIENMALENATWGNIKSSF